MTQYLGLADKDEELCRSLIHFITTSVLRPEKVRGNDNVTHLYEDQFQFYFDLNYNPNGDVILGVVDAQRGKITFIRWILRHLKMSCEKFN